MPEDYLQFVPSRVEGLAGVVRVSVFPNRLELLTSSQSVTILLADIAAWPRPRWLWRRLAGWGLRLGHQPVADRDWFHAPSDRFFRFFAQPPLTVYMPDERGVQYGKTVFRRIQEVLSEGGFTTFDLG